MTWWWPQLAGPAAEKPPQIPRGLSRQKICPHLSAESDQDCQRSWLTSLQDAHRHPPPSPSTPNASKHHFSFFALHAPAVNMAMHFDCSLPTNEEC